MTLRHPPFPPPLPPPPLPPSATASDTDTATRTTTPPSLASYSATSSSSLPLPSLLLLLLLLLLALCPLQGTAIFFPPAFVEQPKELILYRTGSTVTLPCSATGNPRVLYQWRRNNRPHKWNLRDERYQLLRPNGTIVIKGPRPSDDGWYQCIVRNRLGRALTRHVRLQRAYITNIKSSKAVVKATLGQSLSIPCAHPDSFPRAHVQWSFRQGDDEFAQQQFVKEDARTAMDLKGSLLFASVRVEDEKKVYTCSATNRFLRFTVHGEDVRLDLKASANAPPTSPIRLLYHSPPIVVALANETVRLRCFFAGWPVPQISWTKDGVDRLPTGATVLADGVELRLTKFQLSHAGTYRCHGSNSEDRAGKSSDFNIRMESKPTWVKKPGNLLLPANSSYEVECDARGIPTPNVDWFVNGRLMNSYDDNDKFVVGRRLVLKNLRPKDTAVIQCNASNIHGSIFVNYYINILKDPPEFKRRPALMQKSPEGRKAILTCETYSAPRAEVRWLHNSRLVNVHRFRGRHRLTPEGNLEIEPAETSDSGHYTCEARNPFGMVRAAGRLTVTKATRITAPIESRIIKEGQQVKFSCEAVTDPREVINLTFQWFKDGRPLHYSDSPRYHRDDGIGEKLVIRHARPEDSGVYECVASNALDEDRRNATLLVKGRPAAPRALRADCKSRAQDQLALLSWTPGEDNNAPILRYDVQFALVTQNATVKPPKWRPAEISADGLAVGSSRPPLNFTLARLRPWLNYTFRVAAHNEVGTSTPSRPTTQRCGLLPSLPTKNPTDLTVFGDNPKQLTVKWTPMSELDQNGPNLVYHLTVACLNCRGEMLPTFINKTTIANWRRDRIVFNDLYVVGRRFKIETYRRYRVTIKSENQIGLSTASAVEVTGYSGEDKPMTRPTDLQQIVKNDGTKSHLIRLIWKRPDDLTERAVRGRFRGYRVRWCDIKMSHSQCEREMHYKDILNDDKEGREKAPPNHVSVTLSSLPGLARLRIWVCVINTKYCGDPSNTIIVETKEGTPGPVSEFNMVAMGANHLDFEWAKPLQINGVLTGYQLGIQQRDSLKGDGGMIKRFPPINDKEQLSDRIIGLRPNTNYRVFIWARTSQGNGQPAHLDVRTANANVPSEPKFKVHSITGSSLNVTLLPDINSNGGEPQIFYVQYQKQGSATWEQTRTEYGARRWILLTGLESGTSYYLRVISGSSGEHAVYSKPMLVNTRTRSGVDSLFASGLIWLVVLGCAVLCLGVFLVGLCYFRHKRLKYARGKPLPTQESEKPEHNEYAMAEQITRLPGSGTLQRPMRDMNNHIHHDTLYMTKLGSSCVEDQTDLGNTANGRGYNYTSLTKSPVNTIPTSFV